MKPMIKQLEPLIRRAKAIARQYHEVTGRPLGITGEVAEFEAARLLKLKLASVRQEGYDATRTRRGGTERIQIKGRCILSRNPGQRIGEIDLSKTWDCVVLVLLGPDLEPLSM